MSFWRILHLTTLHRVSSRVTRPSDFGTLPQRSKRQSIISQEPKLHSLPKVSLLVSSQRSNLVSSHSLQLSRFHLYFYSNHQHKNLSLLRSSPLLLNLFGLSSATFQNHYVRALWRRPSKPLLDDEETKLRKFRFKSCRRIRGFLDRYSDQHHRAEVLKLLREKIEERKNSISSIRPLSPTTFKLQRTQLEFLPFNNHLEQIAKSIKKMLLQSADGNSWQVPSKAISSPFPSFLIQLSSSTLKTHSTSRPRRETRMISLKWYPNSPRPSIL